MLPVWMIQQKLKTKTKKQSIPMCFSKWPQNVLQSIQPWIQLPFYLAWCCSFGVQAGHQTSSWSLNKHWAVYINICRTGKELYSLPASLPHFHLLSVAFARSVRKKMVPHLSSDYFWLPWADVFLHEHSVFTLMFWQDVATCICSNREGNKDLSHALLISNIFSTFHIDLTKSKRVSLGRVARNSSS